MIYVYKDNGLKEQLKASRGHYRSLPRGLPRTTLSIVCTYIFYPITTRWVIKNIRCFLIEINTVFCSPRVVVFNVPSRTNKGEGQRARGGDTSRALSNSHQASLRATLVGMPNSLWIVDKISLGCGGFKFGAFYNSDMLYRDQGKEWSYHTAILK